MKRLSALLCLVIVLVPVLQGCSPTRRQVFVGPGGGVVTCTESGHGLGLWAMAISSNNYNDCCWKMRMSGFLEVERAGVLGLILGDPDEDGHPSVLEVKEASPAWRAGIELGDFVLEVEGQEVRGVKDAQALLFGVADTPVTVRFLHGGADTTVTLTRASQLIVFGYYPPTGGS
jgi:hypothetical protein